MKVSNKKHTRVKFNESVQTLRCILDLNTLHLLDKVSLLRRTDKKRSREDSINASDVMATVLYNLASGVWQLSRPADNAYMNRKSKFTRTPLDSYRISYIHFQPSFILPMAKILDTLEDAVKVGDTENALRLILGAKSIIAEEISEPHPKIEKLLNESPDFTKYFVRIEKKEKGNRAYRLNQKYTPSQIKEIFGDRVILEEEN